MEPGESFEAAARRELREETGVIVAPLGPCIWTRDAMVRLNGEDVLLRERYYPARVGAVEVVLDHQTDAAELTHHRGFAWWQVEEVDASGERLLPGALADLLAPLLRGQVPAAPIALR